MAKPATPWQIAERGCPSRRDVADYPVIRNSGRNSRANLKALSLVVLVMYNPASVELRKDIRHLRTSIAIAFCLGLFSPAAALANDLPQIDYDTIERSAQAVTQGERYITSLPARRRECTETARPFSSSMSIDALFAGLNIRRVCLRAMILKLTEIHGGPAGLNPIEMAKNFDWISDAVQDLKMREAAGGMGGCDRDDLCTGLDWEFYGKYQHIKFLSEMVAALAVFNATKLGLPGFDTDDWLAAWEAAGEL